MTTPPPLLEGTDKMTAPYIEKYAIDAKMYGHLYGQLVVI